MTLEEVEHWNQAGARKAAKEDAEARAVAEEVARARFEAEAEVIFGCKGDGGWEGALSVAGVSARVRERANQSEESSPGCLV